MELGSSYVPLQELPGAGGVRRTRLWRAAALFGAYSAFALLLAVRASARKLAARPLHLTTPLSTRRASCTQAGLSPCIRESALTPSFKGDASRDRFARRDENLIFFDTFSESHVDFSVWAPDQNMAGDFNGCFEYYTSLASNLYINHTDESLRLKPGFFEDLGVVNTAAGPRPAGDVLSGRCTPYPACATFRIPNCSAEPCEVVGSPESILSPVTSAKVTTRDSFSFTYGRIEVEMTMPAGDYLWPAVWMMPHDSKYGIWPDSGEIDMLESHGNADYRRHGQPAGRERFASTLHFMGNAWWAAQGDVVAGSGRNDWAERPFTLGMYWSEKEMYTYIRDPPENETEHVLFNVSGLNRLPGNSSFFDYPYGASFNLPPDTKEGRWQRDIMTHVEDDPQKQPYRGAAPNAPFDQPFYLILNVAVGGAQNGCPTPDYWGEKAIWCRCFPNCTGSPMTEFWRLKDEWMPSWQEASAADALSMTIYSVKVWQ